MVDIKISEIVVENRVRAAIGWLDSLERSIQQVGVLQPIGITSTNKLIFGGRRLQACINLGLETIPARIFDIDADDLVTTLRMEREENEHRKDLTPSEKVALAQKIEEALAGRRGSNQYQQKELPQNFAEPPKGESRDIAAKAVGMNRETYRQAKAVVESGNQEEIQAMDSGEKSINAAYKNIKDNNPESRPGGCHIRENKPKQQRGQEMSTKTFKITLFKNPKDDAEILLAKGGRKYCTELALVILKAAGHSVEEFVK